MSFEHRGYWINQSDYNNHIMIVQNNRMVMHAACEEKLTEDQLRGIVDGYIEYRESGDAAAIWRDIMEGDE